MNSDEIYQEIILDNYRNPNNFGKIDSPTIHYKDSNTSCGDTIEISILLKANKIKDIKFTGKGCAISMASASLLTESLKNKSITEIKKLKKEDILKMLGIPLSGIRLKCALLILKVIKYGTYNYLGAKLNENDFT